jgi:hypothetical protein
MTSQNLSVDSWFKDTNFYTSGIEKNCFYRPTLSESEEVKQLIKQETCTRHGFRASMALAGASLLLLASPAGLIVAPVVAGIMLLGAATIFIYRQRIEQRFEGLRHLQQDKKISDDMVYEELTIPDYNWKDDLKKGLLCFTGVGALKVYYDDYRSARELREQAESARHNFDHRRGY